MLYSIIFELNPIKKLAGQTAVYGLGTLVPRLLNYLLVPLYTRLFLEDEYGIITELYSWIAFFFVVLLYGMETTFFRFVSKDPDPKRVFSTSLFTVLITSLFFLFLVLVLINPVSAGLRYTEHKDFIVYSAIIVAIDAVMAIPFAYLRHQNRAVRFSVIRIISVMVNIGLNLYFIWFCTIEYRQNPDSHFLFFYDPEFRIGYVFVSNLVSSLITVILLIPQYARIKPVIDRGLLKRMLTYSYPLLIVGLAGMVNEVWDKIIFKFLIRIPAGIADPEAYALGQLGIYGANYKLAVLMSLFVQMFRFAAEPFFFSQSKEVNAKQVYADVMKYFVIFGLLIFLLVTLYIDIFKYFIGPKHWEGLFIVPIVLMANLLLGIFFNLSIWYKLQDKTKYGAWIALGGASITILFNVLLVPRYSYFGAAIGHLACYLFMVILSYFQGQKHYRVPYDLSTLLMYFALALLVFAISYYIKPEYQVSRLLLNSCLLIVFIILVYFNEKHSFLRPHKKDIG